MYSNNTNYFDNHEETIFYSFDSHPFSCNKTGENNAKDIDSTKIIDSINAVRMKYNDSIRALNNKNNFGDLSGKHKLTFVSDDGVSLTGTVNFTKIMSDGYEVKGNAKSGKTYSSLTEKRTEYRQNTSIFTEKLQTINGKTESKSNSNTFRDEGKGVL